jgi:hypothetical protein
MSDQQINRRLLVWHSEMGQQQFPALRRPKNWARPHHLRVARVHGDPTVLSGGLSGPSMPTQSRGLPSLLSRLDVEELIEASLANGWTESEDGDA